MKKFLTILLTLAMLLPLGVTAVFANDTESDTSDTDATSFQPVTFNFLDKVDVVTESGIDMGGPFSAHGNHQTRIVHTSHGDYLCSTTGEHRSGNYLVNGFSDGIYEVSVLRVDPETDESTVVLQHTVAYQSSQISVIADKDENIWAAIIIEETIRNQFDAHKNGTRIELFRIDAVTNEVEFFDMIVSDHDINRGGVGYSSFYYDESIDCIIAFSTDAVAGDVHGRRRRAPGRPSRVRHDQERADARHCRRRLVRAARRRPVRLGHDRVARAPDEAREQGGG